MTQCGGFPNFWFFLNFLCPFQNAVKMVSKNIEQNMRQLQFKFDPFPVESAGICRFHQRWIKTFFTQPFGQLCIIYVLVFYKIDLVQFCNNYLGGPSQKKLISGTRKWKMYFPCKENENSLFGIRRCTLVHNMRSFEQTMPWMWPWDWSFGLKAIDLHTW